MSQEITQTKTFEEAIIDRLRRDIGDLMPPEALAAMVEKGMHKIFFDKKETRSSYGSSTYSEYSWFEEEVRVLMREQVKEQLTKYLKENPQVLEEQLKRVIDAGFLKCVGQALDNAMATSMYNMSNDLRKQLGMH